ncbi:MAG: FAD-binding protein, partial [Pseudomonadota bacterium]
MSLLAALSKIPGGGLAPAEALEGALQDPVTLQRGTAEALMRPASTEAVSAIVKVCAAHDVSITPRGGGSGFVAGAIPLAEGSNVILSLARMNAIRTIAPEDESITLEAGVVLATA